MLPVNSWGRTFDNAILRPSVARRWHPRSPTASDGLSRKEFEKELAKLQVELARLQQRRPKNVTEGLGGAGQPIPNHY